MRPDPDNQLAGPEVTVGVRPARLATTNITNWKLEQQEDPVLYQVVKHRKASRETFKEALLKVTDRKAVSAYVKSKEQLVMRNGLLYRQSKQGQTQETVLQFVVPQIHRNAALDGCHREAAHPYLSCKNNSGGLAWLVTSGIASGNAVIARSLRPLHQWPH